MANDGVRVRGPYRSGMKSFVVREMKRWGKWAALQPFTRKIQAERGGGRRVTVITR